MISGLKIGNFKAFGPTQEIPLAPITLVFGPNSSGKSSIIQSLLLLRHIHDTGNVDAFETSLGGKAVDLGGFAKYVHRREGEREVSIELEFPKFEKPKNFKELLDLESLSVGYAFGQGCSPAPQLKRVGLKDCEITFTRSQDGSFSRRAVEIRKPSSMPEFDDEMFWELIQQPRLKEREARMARVTFRSEGLNLIPSNPLPRENYDYDQVASSGDLDRPDYDPYGFFKRWLEKEEVDAEVRAFVYEYDIECVLDLMNATVLNCIKDFSYLGPLRWMPPRVLALGGEPDIATGAFAWSQLMREPELLRGVNRHLAKSIRADFRLECRHRPLERSATEIERIVQDAMTAATERATPEARVAEEPDHDAHQARLGEELKTRLQSKSGDPVFELAVVDNTTGLAISHRDVGTGISQLLPVLVHAASQKEQLIMVEQPELHLHPKLQADLGDVFRDSALGENKNTFLIETHSEHLILRLLRRIRETTGGQHGDAPPVRPDDVALLYVEPREEGAVVHRLRVDEHGRLLDPCPSGFFEEDFDEVF